MGINKLLKNKSIFNNGFAITSMIYLILVMAIILVTLSLAILNNRHLILDKQKDKSFDNIYSKDSAIKEINYLMTSSSISSAETTFLGGMILRSKVESTTIVDNKEVPSNVIGSWDVSEKQNGSIVAWYEEVDNDGLYDVYIGQEEGVKANSNSAFLFMNMKNVTSMDLSKFDTKNVTNMRWMFSNCWSLTELDISSFDMQNVTDILGMFGAISANKVYVKDEATKEKITEEISELEHECEIIIKP